MSNFIFTEIRTIFLSVTLVAVSAIVGLTYYNVNDRILMSKNIDAAIAKGVDPLSVSCSFVIQSDTICVAYAAAQGTSRK